MNTFRKWLLKTRPQIIVSVSGGKDSTEAYLYAMDLGLPFRAVMADTGHEHPFTMDFAEQLGPRTGGPSVEFVKADFKDRIIKRRDYVATKWPAKGIEQSVIDRVIEHLHPTGNPYLDLCILKGRFPSRMAQFCTEELKVIPITRQIILPALKRGPVVQFHGVRADESTRRGKLPKVEWHEDTGSIIYRPILHRSLSNVFTGHKRHNLVPNKLYSMGMGRVGCYPCINCTKDELRNIATRTPEAIEKLREWERIVGLASKAHRATFFTEYAEMNGAGGDIDNVVAWSKTTRGGRQYDLLLAAEDPALCSSKYGMCE